MPKTVVGVISDTHSLMREQALHALAGSHRILHAGDIGSPDILDSLAQLAPVTAVRGNIDRTEWARQLPVTTAIEIGGLWLYMLHNLDELDLDPADHFAAVIAGHSHQPRIEERDGVLYFNPGSAGPRRFKLPVSVGRLTIAGNRISGELIELSV
ncbi:MAG: metallophosphatase family protein [Proteobacteria bacterium]|nr:metallophosphatase family protein [Pseudomonadota bacterium]